MNVLRRESNERGLTLLIALLVTTVMLSASVAIANIALQEVIFSISERDSNRAFFAADLGAECATYWDLTRNMFNDSSLFYDIECGGDEIRAFATSSPTHDFDVEFDIEGDERDFCSKVVIDTDFEGDENNSQIESRGYSSSCNDLTSRSVERALRVEY